MCWLLHRSAGYDVAADMECRLLNITGPRTTTTCLHHLLTDPVSRFISTTLRTLDRKKSLVGRRGNFSGLTLLTLATCEVGDYLSGKAELNRRGEIQIFFNLCHYSCEAHHTGASTSTMRAQRIFGPLESTSAWVIGGRPHCRACILKRRMSLEVC